jgi:hypothetical protein
LKRTQITAAQVACGVTAGAGVSVENAAGAAGLRVRDRLLWTHLDGTRVTFRPDVRVWCGRWERDVKVPSIHVRIGALTAPRWERVGSEFGDREPLSVRGSFSASAQSG